MLRRAEQITNERLPDALIFGEWGIQLWGQWLELEGDRLEDSGLWERTEVRTDDVTGAKSLWGRYVGHGLKRRIRKR